MAENNEDKGKPGPRGGPDAVPIDGPFREMARMAREAFVDSVTGRPISSSRALARKMPGKISHSTIVNIWRGVGVDAPSLITFARGTGMDRAGTSALLTAGGHDPAMFDAEIEASQARTKQTFASRVRETSDSLAVPPQFAYLTPAEREKVQFTLEVAVQVAIRQRELAAL